MHTAAAYGLGPFYSKTGSDYPPLNVYIFWVFGSMANAVSNFGISAVNFMKLAPNLFDLGTGILIYFFARKQAGFKLAFVAMALYIFNPAVIFDSAVWGQYDAVYTLFLLLSLMLAIKSKPQFSAAAFALALLAKPQGIALAPLIAFLIYKKNGLKNLLFSVLAFAAVVFLVILPFNWGGSPTSFLTHIYFTGYSEYSYTTMNAFNLWALITGMWVHDGYLNIVGWGLFAAFTIFTLYFLNKRFKGSGDYLAVFAAFMILFGFFMLPTRIHERYMFPAISVLALMFPLIKRARLFYVVLTGTLLVNEAYVLNGLRLAYPHAYPSASAAWGDPVVLAVSAINLIMLAYASIVMWDKRKWLKTVSPPPEQTAKRSEPT